MILQYATVFQFVGSKLGQMNELQIWHYGWNQSQQANSYTQ